ncbi:hypothetical protein CEUSTIGMA_g10830.t1 [Chlamydomonas eustigma]|uniref:Peptidase S8/S53 domain-containing protein n=1 Tax=Chlamydomonas eustigma TaxID=1157962 RepID=A0A250XJZ4_9CHLO|nr:hypothetical protein CEUSTIGMA_g10830.t1 [Chlamydomonas eustigma]|eukprot:GAX83405.1 hypothetical protein CEUSTIGMA_g10830.t1 [Chlamydomonas eustigma]
MNKIYSEKGIEDSTVLAARSGGLISWVRLHPRSTAACVVAILSILVLSVALPACTILGCPKKSPSQATTMVLSPGPSRLLVHYLNTSVDALDLIPAILRQYIDFSRINSSDIQILNFQAEAILQQALTYLTSEESLNFLTRDFNMSLVLPNNTNIQELLSGGTTDTTLQSILSQLSSIASGGNGNDGSKMRVVNDPFYLNGSQYYIDLVNGTGAWEYTSGAPVVVAIIDVGIDMGHPDLVPSLWVNSGEIPDNGIDDDNNGFVDDLNGYNFAGQCTGYSNVTGMCSQCGGNSIPSSDSSVDPEYYHGTHVAGLAGGTQDNGIGITGLAFGIKLMILRVSDCMTGAIQASVVFQAYDYALKMGAHIISCSFGASYAYGFTPSTLAPSYHAQWTAAYVSALRPLSEKGILAVVSAGNEAIDMDLLSSLGYSYCPCLVNLSNVLCVGGTDPEDNLASFSNFGVETVQIGSPAVQIYSTLYQNSSGVISHTYGPLNGTSMAAPIVSGSAAMMLSLLGAADGNYYKGQQVYSLIENYHSAVNGPSPLPFHSRARLDAGAAIYQASIQLGAALTQGAAIYGLTSPPASSVTFSGMLESYYTSGGLYNSTILGPPLDTTLRNISSPNYPPSFSTFKYYKGVLVSLKSLLLLTQPGVWSFQISTTTTTATGTALPFWLLVNGQQLLLNSTTQVALFMAQNPGWYSFEIRISSPSPSSRYSLALKSPSSNKFSTYYGFLAEGPLAAVGLPDYAQNANLSNVWQVFYNPLNITTQPISISTLSTITTATAFHFATATQDTTNIPTQASSLLSGGISISTSSIGKPLAATAALGLMQTFLIPTPGSWRNPLSFTVTCTGCQLLVDGVVVVDIYEPLLSDGIAISKTSPCLALTINQAHSLVLRFASPSLSQAVLKVQCMMCGSALQLDLHKIIYNPLIWQPEASVASGNSAFIGGLQVDVYRSTTNGTMTSFAAQSTRAIYKVRLPTCPSMTEETINGTCSGTWSFSLESLLPGITAGTPVGVTYGVRCWTTWNQGFTNGVIAVTPTAGNPVAYLGGIQIYGSGGSNLAPSTTLLGNMYQMLVVDWFDLNPDTVLSVQNNGGPLPIDLVNMRLPIGGLANVSGYDLMNATVVVGKPGASTASTFPPEGDIFALVDNDLSRAFTAESAAAAAVNVNGSSNIVLPGLDVMYSYPSLQSPTQLHYTIANGFFLPSAFSSGNNLSEAVTIQVFDTDQSSTMLVMGNVTLRNAPLLSATGSNYSVSTFQVFCPVAAFLRAYAICKTSTIDYNNIATTTFNVSTVSVGPWSAQQWSQS